MSESVTVLVAPARFEGTDEAKAVEDKKAEERKPKKPKAKD